MTTYNTGNPIGSKDGRDLYDNAQNLDNFANGTADSYTDRLGVSRRSLAGIDRAADNVLNAIGYAVPVAYAGGISLTLTSQTVDYNGVIYAPQSSALPFTTSSWGTDQSKFRAIQVTDADLITYNPAGTGAVATTVQSKLREVVSVKDFGVLPGSTYAISNCAAYEKLIAHVRLLGSNVEIFWPPGEYQFSPKDDPAYSGGPDYAWRADVELVDVTNVYHRMDGVTVYLRANPAWYRGNSTPKVGLDEGVIQFRASTQGGCSYVGYFGHAIFKTDQTIAAPSGYPDGATFGVAYRGCQHTYSGPAKFEWWGTDGLYFGQAYGNAFGGSDHVVMQPHTYRCYRQGISVVGNSNGVIYGGLLEQTQGSSFGHGIDFEPNGANTQNGWTLIGTATKNNQRGACNFINTSDVLWVNPQIDEQASSTNGAVYIDGSNIIGYDVKNIQFYGGYIQSLAPVLYVSGTSSPRGGIDNVTFRGTRLSCLGNAPAGNAFLRVNPQGMTGTKIGRFLLDECTIDGNGGIIFKSNGSNEARLIIKGGKWNLTNHAGSTIAFDIATSGSPLDVIDIDGVDMSIASDKSMVTRTPYITNGSLKNCRLSGQVGARIAWQDWGGGRSNFVIGYNEFSAYNYYKGVVLALDIKGSGAVETPITGDYDIKGRLVHGGRQRIVAYINNPSAFTDRQAPRDGDIARNVGNLSSSWSVTEYTYITSLAQWLASKWITRKGTTGARPSTTGTTISDQGLQYLDTTLTANGKLITWNGSAWVDSTGAAT